MNQSKLLPTFAVLLTTTACVGSTGRRAPLNAETEAERIEAYETFAPEADAFEFDEAIAANGSLSLRGGREVQNVRELLPRVAPTSATALNVEEMEQQEQAAEGWFAGGMAASSVGIVGMSIGGLGLMVLSQEQDLAAALGEYKHVNRTPYITTVAISALLTAAGTIAATIGQSVHKSNAEDSRQAAFRSYEADLLQFLDLCRQDGRVTPCHSQLSQNR